MRGVIIWDWNGTLLDDTQAAVDALNLMLGRRSLKSLSLEFYKERFRFPARDFYEEIGIKVRDDEWDELAKEYHSTYATFPVKLAEGVVEALEAVSRAGLRQVIASALRNDLLKAQVSSFGIAEYFSEVRGTDNLDGAGKKEIVRHLMEDERAKAKGEKVNLVMIGDALHDWEVATSLGERCVLCATGGHSARRLREVSDSVLSLTEAASRAISIIETNSR